MATISSSSGSKFPDISRELADVLFRASLINARREKNFDLSYATTLLGFITSRMPIAQWFKDYVESHRIDVEAILASRKVDRVALDEARNAEPGNLDDLDWRRTVAMKGMFEAANQLRMRADRVEASFDKESELDERHLMGAYIYRSDHDHKRELESWGFDLVDWSNSFLAILKLKHPDELENWMEVHQETFKLRPELPPAVDAEPMIPGTPAESGPGPSQAAADVSPPPLDQTQLLLDCPSLQDVLGRKYFAETLAVRMKRAWESYRDSNAKGSFMLHIHGAWGSGKSSLLNLLRAELQQPKSRRLKSKQPPNDNPAVGWIVVDFNAWQRQRVEPPWWSLIDTIYVQSRDQLKTVYDESDESFKLTLRERWWRFTTGRKDHLIAMFICFLLLGGVFYWAKSYPSSLPDVIKSGATLIGVVGGIWSTLLLVSRSLISGSSQSAQAFMQRSGDPMERVAKHFIDLVHWVDRPIAIFIDDLDRCQTTYVVTLLEGMQTLFNTPRVVYVITADRRWLHVCFEKIYENFVGAVKEPGRQLGSLFLEKAFETSISMPRMSPERKKLYWDHLVQGKLPALADVEAVTAKIAAEFKGYTTEPEVLGGIKVSTGSVLEDEIRKGAAVRQLANQKVVESTEYFLRPFAPLTEPNPRAMKRLVNAYTLLRDLAILGGSDLLFDTNTNARKQLALWSIVSLRWPLLKEHLEEHLEENPDETPDIIELICTRQPLPLVKVELTDLVKSNEVYRVFTGDGIGTKLDKKTICSLVGISAAQPKSGGVA